MSKLPPFAANQQALFELSVDELGRLLLDHFVAAQAEKLNIPRDLMPDGFEERVRRYVLTLEARTAGGAAVEKALHKAALGDFSAAGTIIRQHQVHDALFIKLEKFRRAEIERLATARRAGGQAASERRREKNGPRDQRIRERANLLLRSGKNERDLASLLGSQFGITSRQIRKILKAQEKRN